MTTTLRAVDRFEDHKPVVPVTPHLHRFFPLDGAWVGLSLAVLLASLVGGCATGAMAEFPIETQGLLAATRVDDYRASPPDAVLPESQKRLVDLVYQAIPPEHRNRVRHEPRLDGVARIDATLYGGRNSWPSPTARRWLFWRAGVTAVPSHTKRAWASGGNYHERLDQKLIAQAVEALQPQQVPLVFGIARVRTGARMSQVLVVASERLSLQPVGKRHPPGTPVKLTGNAPPLSKSIEICVNQVFPDVNCQRTKTDAAAPFEAFVTLPTAPGRYDVEIRGQIEDGNDQVSLGHFPLFVDIAEPDSFEAHKGLLPPVEPEPRSPQAFLDYVNGERSRLGFAPLQSDPIAQSYVDAQNRRLSSGAEIDEVATLKQYFAQRGIPFRKHWRSWGSEVDVELSVWSFLQTPSIRRDLFAEEPPLTALSLIDHEDPKRGFRYVLLILKPTDPQAK